MPARHSIAPHPAGFAASPCADAGGTPLRAALSLRHTVFRHTVHDPPIRESESKPDPESKRTDAGAVVAVRILDNSVNTYEEVMAVCSAALGISIGDAYAIAHEVDTAGSCVVLVAPQAEAERVAAHIGTIGIEVRLEPLGAPAGRA
jgi:ATP-dependent Clp protease adapter protein ClpS